MCYFVSIRFHLMGSNDVVQIVGSQECFRYIWTKLDSHASFGWRTPSLWLWIRPQKIAHDTIFRRLPKSFRLYDIVERDTILAEKASVHDENFTIEAMTKWKAIIHFGEEINHLVVILGLHLPFESVHLIHRGTFVISSRHEKFGGIEKFKGEKGENDFDGEGSAIYEVAVEKVRVF